MDSLVYRSIYIDKLHIWKIIQRSEHTWYTIYTYLLIVCLLKMCRALFIQNEKADIIHRIPFTLSNQLSSPAYTHLNTHHHHTTIYRDMLH